MKTLNFGKIKLSMHENGFPKGFVLKRYLTLREAKHILKNLLGIDIASREEFCDKEEFEDYNRDLLFDVNDWLEGRIDDDKIAQYAYDCSDDQLGLFNMLTITSYLQKKGII